MHVDALKNIYFRNNMADIPGIDMKFKKQNAVQTHKNNCSFLGKILLPFIDPDTYLRFKFLLHIIWNYLPRSMCQ